MSVTESPAPSGLRERKKLATRKALAMAAMRLAVERGLENVLVEDIAAEAQVSPRTFNNYFASKYEAICALALDRSRRVGEALAGRPPAEGLWEAIRAAVLEVYPATDHPAHQVSGIRLVTRSPALRGEYLKALGLMQYDLAHAIAARMGEEPRASCFARGLAGAVVSALQAATESWVEADSPASLRSLAADALDDVAAGMLLVLPRPFTNGRPPC